MFIALGIEWDANTPGKYQVDIEIALDNWNRIWYILQKEGVNILQNKNRYWQSRTVNILQFDTLFDFIILGNRKPENSAWHAYLSIKPPCSESQCLEPPSDGRSVDYKNPVTISFIPLSLEPVSALAAKKWEGADSE